MLSKVSILAAALLLFSFKYPLDGFYDSGLRMDDAIILVYIIFFVYLTGVVDAPVFIKLISVFVLLGAISGFISSLAGTGVSFLTSLLYSLRHLEYMFIFSIGRYVGLRTFSRMLKLFVLYQFAIVLLQKFGYLSFGTLYNVVERQVGSTGGPWELAVIISAPLFFFIWEKKYFYVAISIFILWSTGSRITVVAVFLALLALLFLSEIRRNRIAPFVVFVVGVIFVLASFFYGVGTAFFDRLFSLVNFDFSILSVAPEMALSQTQYSDFDAKYIKSGLSELGDEASAISRFSRWALALSVFNSYPFYFQIFGLGPSFFGDALDGSFLRIFLTTGFMGLGLYLLFVYKVLTFYRRSNYYLLCFVGVFFVSAIFIDVVYALKANVMFWLLLGVMYSYEKERQKDIGGSSL
ncbi:hypothetical protein [Zhongshania arctica]|uniref:O-antigen polymerase n=1 Tax=Zhongshania arctica TaxID=3238302 RepID=A0ABV3TS33_9GAMM